MLIGSTGFALVLRGITRHLTLLGTNLFQFFTNRRARIKSTPGRSLSGCGGRLGLTGFRHPAIRRVFVLLLRCVGRLCHKLIQESIRPFLSLRSFGCRDFSVLFLLCLLLPLALDLTSDLAHIDSRQLEPFKDAVDLGSIFCPDHNIGQSVVCIFVFQDAVQDTVFLGLLAEQLQFRILNRKYLQRLLASQHIGQPGLTLGFLLVLQNGVNHHRQFLSTCAGDFSGNFNAIE